MTTYDLGDGVNLDHLVYDRDGALTNATVVLTLTAPDGTPQTPTLTNPSTGRYVAETIVPDQLGGWSGAWVASGAVTDVVTFAFSVVDAAPALYTSLPIVKKALGKETVDRDDLIEGAIRAACRRIDLRCGAPYRRFWADVAAKQRKVAVVGQSFYDDGDQVLLVPDISTAEGLLVESGSDSTSWSTVTGWEYGPDDALLDGWPITQLRGEAGWLPATGRVRITARWGWPAVPDGISEAAKLLATRLYRRKDSAQGVMGSSEWGAIRVSRFDPDIEDLISGFTLDGFA